MRELHDRLRSEHHLRHGGRMQYGLFLKGVGLSLQQSLTFWKREFTRKMDPDVVGVVLFTVAMVMCCHNSLTRATHTTYVTIMARKVAVPTTLRTAVPGSLLVIHHQLMITMVIELC